MTPEKLLSIKEVEELLNVSESTIFRLLRNKKLKAFKVGREWRFTPQDIENFIQQQRRESLGETSEGDQTGQLAVTH